MSYKTGFYEGRLGIGLSSTMGMGDGNPRYPLDINGDIRLTGSIVNESGQVLSLVPQESLWTIGTTDITYTGGNVGIGTTSPIGKLQVAESTVDGNLDVVFSAAMDAKCRLVLQRNHGTEHSVIGGSNTIIGDTYYPDWCIENGYNAATQSQIGLKFTSKYKTYPGGVATTNDVMFLDYEGNVGIGTASPETLLHIHKTTLGQNTGGSEVAGNKVRLKITGSNDHASPGIELYEDNSNETHSGCVLKYDGESNAFKINIFGSGTERECISIPRSTGNVGIGTTNPISDLQIGNTLDKTSDTIITTATDGGSIYKQGLRMLIHGGAGGNEAQHGWYIFADDALYQERLRIGKYDGNSNENDVMCISKLTGNVGLKTTSPSIELDVHGDGRIGRHLTGSCHDANKRNSYYFGRWDQNDAPGTGGYPGGAFVGMELLVDSYSNIGYGNCGNQSSVKFWNWGCNYATSRVVMSITADGYVRGINAFQNNSDDRLKHNEKNINVGLNVINKLQAKEYFKTSSMFDKNGNMYGSNHNFNLNTDGLPIDNSGILIKGVTREMGFIAQDVLKIDELKHAVQEGNLLKDASGNTYRPKYGLTYQDIFVMNVAATQELDRKVIALEKENEELKTKLLSVAILESELAAIKQHLGI